MEKIKRGRRLLVTLCAGGILFPAFSCNTNTPAADDPVSWNTARPLHEIYRDHFLIGNIIQNSNDINTTAGNTRFDIVTRHFNTATAENDMKPDHLAPSSPPADNEWTYRWTSADKIVNAVNNAGLAMHGHTLIWHSQSPAWLAKNGEADQKDAALANLKKYVTDVTTHFKGRVISWDVVNEAMRDGLPHPGGGWEDSLRLDDSNWNKAIGPEYIEAAFLAARAADPDAQLFYNDYNLNNENKAKAVYNMVNDINTRYPNVNGRPLVDGVGMQTHHHLGTDPQSVDTSIKLFASLGVDVAVTEMDIRAYDAGFGKTNLAGWEYNDTAAREQAKQYAAMFRVFINNADKLSRVTFWGLDDRTSWLNPRYTEVPCYATLLDRDYNLKPAFYAVCNPSKY